MSIKNQPVLIDFPKIVCRNNKTQAHLNWLKKHIKYFSLSAQLSSQYLRGEKTNIIKIGLFTSFEMIFSFIRINSEHLL